VEEKLTKTMEIAFKKIPTTGIDFEAIIDGFKFYGIVKKISRNLVECKGQLKGFFPHQCDRCGEEFEVDINEDISIFANDGLYDSDGKLLNVVEFFDDCVNFDIMLESEIGTIKSDYHYCSTCK